MEDADDDDDQPKTKTVTTWSWDRVNVQAAIWPRDTKEVEEGEDKELY